MAAAQSSQDMWLGCGRQPQTLGNAQPRHRSESRRLSDRRRPVKTEASKLDRSLGALQEGDAVRVFSRSAALWMDGEVVKLLESDLVRVEWEFDEYWFGKTMHLHSEHLHIPSTVATSSDEDLSFSIAANISGGRPSVELDPGTHDAMCEYGKLSDLETIFNYMEATGLRLVKGEYLKELHERKHLLPRRQDIADSNLWSGAELRKRVKDIRDARLLLVAISHPWWSKQHPDPDGSQLAKIVFILERFQKGGRTPTAIFYCFCCAPQHDWRDPAVCKWMNLPEAERERKMLSKGIRTDAEEQSLRLILQHMHIPYASAKFTVFLLDDDDVPLNATNPTPYSDRGWTTFERAVARLGSVVTISLKAFNGRGISLDASSRFLHGRAMPDEFETEIKSKIFYSCRDCSQVFTCYRHAYRELVTETPHKYVDGFSEEQILWEAEHLHRYVSMRTATFTILPPALTTRAVEALKEAVAGQCHGPRGLRAVELKVAFFTQPGMVPLQDIGSLGNHCETVGLVNFELDFLDRHEVNCPSMREKLSATHVQWQQLLAVLPSMT